MGLGQVFISIHLYINKNIIKIMKLEVFSNTEFPQILCYLPMFSTITDEEIGYVVNILEKLLKSKN